MYEIREYQYHKYSPPIYEIWRLGEDPRNDYCIAECFELETAKSKIKTLEKYESETASP